MIASDDENHANEAAFGLRMLILAAAFGAVPSAALPPFFFPRRGAFVPLGFDSPVASLAAWGFFPEAGACDFDSP